MYLLLCDSVCVFATREAFGPPFSGIGPQTLNNSISVSQDLNLSVLFENFLIKQTQDDINNKKNLKNSKIEIDRAKNLFNVQKSNSKGPRSGSLIGGMVISEGDVLKENKILSESVTYASAIQAYNLGQREVCVAILKKIILHDKHSLDDTRAAKYFLAELYYKDRNFTEAKKIYLDLVNTSLNVDKDITAIKNLIAIRIEEDPRGAVKELKKIVNKYSDNAYLMSQVGSAYYKSGMLVEAIQSFVKSVNLDSNNFDNISKLAKLLCINKNYNEGMVMYNRAIVKADSQAAVNNLKKERERLCRAQ